MPDFQSILDALRPLGLREEQIYLRGECLCLQVDCLKVLPLLPEGCVDAIVSDHPYGIKDGAAFVRKNTLEVGDGSGEWNEGHSWRWLASCEYLKAGGNVACFARREDTLPPSIREWHRYYIIKESSPPTPRKVFVSAVEQCLIGTKPGGKRTWAGGGWELNYWRGLTPKRRNDGTQTGHPAEKPLGAIVTLVRCLSEKHNLILDPFAGSFTTAVACLRTGRAFIGMEIEKEYFDIGVARLEKEFTRLSLLEPPPPRMTQKELL